MFNGLQIVLVAIALSVPGTLCRGTRLYDSEAEATPLRGSPWPMPQFISTTPDVQMFDAAAFEFEAVGSTCDVLESAFKRYFFIIFGMSRNKAAEKYDAVLKFRAMWRRRTGGLDKLEVNVETPCAEQYPSLDMDESCKS